MRILVAGGTGLIGSALLRALIEEGHSIALLSRSKREFPGLEKIQTLVWDGVTTKGWGESVNDVDAIINLAGENIGRFPWTAGRKAKFRESRVFAGQALAKAIRESRVRPKTFIQASAVGFYGPRGNERIDETSSPGMDFSSRLCADWEDSTRGIEDLGIRRVLLRTGIVLSNRGGVLPKMAFPVKLFVGGRLGSGQQGIPWIHVDDEINAIQFLLRNESAKGAYNLSAPNPVSNSVFMKTLAEILHRPYWLHIPSFIIRILLGDMSTLLLDGQFVIPARLLESGFKFNYHTLELALDDFLGKEFSSNRFMQ